MEINASDDDSFHLKEDLLFFKIHEQMCTSHVSSHIGGMGSNPVLIHLLSHLIKIQTGVLQERCKTIGTWAEHKILFFFYQLADFTHHRNVMQTIFHVTIDK